MNVCANCRKPAEVKPYAHHLGHKVSLLCADCLTSLTGIGMSLTLIERRAIDAPVEHDRRRFVPTWLRNLTGRDNTGELVA